MFPFLEFDTSSWGQWALARLVAWPRTVGAAVAAAGCLPTVLQRGIVRRLAGLAPSSACMFASKV